MRSLRSLALAVFIAALVVSCSSTPGKPAPAASPPVTVDSTLVGDWNGTLRAKGQSVPVGITFTTHGATVTVPLQDLRGKNLTQVSGTPNAVAFTIPGIDGAFHGSYDRGTDAITGTYTQAGQSMPLTLTRGTVPEPPRPQQPRPPFPYRSEDVSYGSDGNTLAGTLTLPSGPGPFPAVLMIAGSGPVDRDETVADHKPFLVLSDALTRAGYAVLRYDKRGVGRSGGDLNSADYTDLTDDVIAGLNYLRGRPEVDKNRIGMLGHSEGGYLAPLAATRPGGQVAFQILLEAPATTGADVLVDQNEAMLAAAHATPEAKQSQIEFISTLATLVRAGDTEQVNEFLAQHNAALPPNQQLSPDMVNTYTGLDFAALVGYDPTAALQQLRVPVLATYGTKDLQVPLAQNEPLMRQDLSQDPNADVQVFDGVNHLLQPATTGLPAEYPTIETTIAAPVLTAITTWLTQHIPPNQRQ